MRRRRWSTPEETGIGEQPTAEANKRVTEVLDQQQSNRMRTGIAHSEESEVTGSPVNRGVGLWLRVPCFYHFDGHQNFIRKLQESLKE